MCYNISFFKFCIVLEPSSIIIFFHRRGQQRHWQWLPLVSSSTLLPLSYVFCFGFDDFSMRTPKVQPPTHLYPTMQNPAETCRPFDVSPMHTPLLVCHSWYLTVTLTSRYLLPPAKCGSLDLIRHNLLGTSGHPLCCVSVGVAVFAHHPYLPTTPASHI